MTNSEINNLLTKKIKISLDNDFNKKAKELDSFLNNNGFDDFDFDDDNYYNYYDDDEFYEQLFKIHNDFISDSEKCFLLVKLLKNTLIKKHINISTENINCILDNFPNVLSVESGINHDINNEYNYMHFLFKESAINFSDDDISLLLEKRPYSIATFLKHNKKSSLEKIKYNLPVDFNFSSFKDIKLTKNQVNFLLKSADSSILHKFILYSDSYILNIDSKQIDYILENSDLSEYADGSYKQIIYDADNSIYSVAELLITNPLLTKEHINYIAQNVIEKFKLSNNSYLSFLDKLVSEPLINIINKDIVYNIFNSFKLEKTHSNGYNLSIINKEKIFKESLSFNNGQAFFNLTKNIIKKLLNNYSYSTIENRVNSFNFLFENLNSFSNNSKFLTKKEILHFSKDDLILLKDYLSNDLECAVHYFNKFKKETINSHLELLVFSNLLFNQKYIFQSKELLDFFISKIKKTSKFDLLDNFIHLNVDTKRNKKHINEYLKNIKKTIIWADIDFSLCIYKKDYFSFDLLHPKLIEKLELTESNYIKKLNSLGSSFKNIFDITNKKEKLQNEIFNSILLEEERFIDTSILKDKDIINKIDFFNKNKFDTIPLYKINFLKTLINESILSINSDEDIIKHEKIKINLSEIRTFFIENIVLEMKKETLIEDILLDNVLIKAKANENKESEDIADSNILFNKSNYLTKIYEYQKKLDPDKQLLLIQIYGLYSDFIFKDNLHLYDYQKKLLEKSITHSLINFLHYYTQLTEIETKTKIGKDSVSAEDLFFNITNKIIKNFHTVNAKEKPKLRFR